MYIRSECVKTNTHTPFCQNIHMYINIIHNCVNRYILKINRTEHRTRWHKIFAIASFRIRVYYIFILHTVIIIQSKIMYTHVTHQNETTRRIDPIVSPLGWFVLCCVVCNSTLDNELVDVEEHSSERMEPNRMEWNGIEWNRSVGVNTRVAEAALKSK